MELSDAEAGSRRDIVEQSPDGDPLVGCGHRETDVVAGRRGWAFVRWLMYLTSIGFVLNEWNVCMS